VASQNISQVRTDAPLLGGEDLAIVWRNIPLSVIGKGSSTDQAAGMRNV